MKEINPSTQLKMSVQLAVTAWDLQNKQLLKLLDTIPNEQLLSEVSPGKNTGHYLLGHLVAVSDAMLPLFGLGESLFPELLEIFIRNPDKSGLSKSSVSELKGNLHAVNTRLSEAFATLSPADWLDRHTAVSAEDFEKEPHRNRLNVLFSRTSHLAYHIGQLALLK